MNPPEEMLTVSVLQFGPKTANTVTISCKLYLVKDNIFYVFHAGMLFAVPSYIACYNVGNRISVGTLRVERGK